MFLDFFRKKSTNQQNKKTPDDILESGDIPSKPSVKRSTFFYSGDEKFDVTFMLSGDFIEFNSHSEIDPSFQYEPFNDEEFTSYDETLASIGFGPFDDQIYDAAENFVKNGKSSGREFLKSDSKYFLFRATFSYYNKILYAYVFAPDTAMEYQALGLEYNPDVEGTSLEKKLIAALDEVATTYKETKTAD